jgi:hypothetical protein
VGRIRECAWQCGFIESAVAPLRVFEFNPVAHELLLTHDFERMESAVQTAAGNR